MRIRNAILLFGIVNASLYSALLPLWEGFDEAFHYGYVESLWQTGRLPVLGRTLLPEDVFQSFQLAPVSYLVQKWIPGSISYDAWFALPQAEKERRRRELEMLRPQPATSTRPNYEAHHPPLAYIPLAAVDWTMSRASLTTRVLLLRWCAAVFTTVLLYFGATSLFRTLNLPEPFANAALFTIFCSQMLYATVAHVANDWLAVGLSALFLAALARFVVDPNRRSATQAGLWLAAGLLTKAYFLAFGALAFAVVAMLIWRRRVRIKEILPGLVLVIAAATPWYIRNVVLYGNAVGTQEQFSGIGVRQALAAFPQIDWLSTSGFLARGSIWMGNNSGTSFSRGTLNIMLLLLAVAFGAWIFHRRLIQPAEQVVFAAIIIFSIAVAYASCASFAYNKGDVPGASPWYTQVLLVPVMALAYLGMSRWARIGRLLATLTAIIWAWVLVATWTIKLFPMYSGAGPSPMRLHEIWDWYLHRAASHAHDLSLLALAPSPLLYAGMIIAVSMTAALCAIVVRKL